MSQIKEESNINLYNLVASASSTQHQFSPNHNNTNTSNNNHLLAKNNDFYVQQQVQQQPYQNHNGQVLNETDTLLSEVKSLEEILSRQNDPLLSNSMIYTENIMDSFS